MPEKTLRLRPLALGVFCLGMAGFWAFAMIFYVSIAAMINNEIPLEVQQQAYYSKVFGGWGIVGYPLVSLFFVFCFTEAARQFVDHFNVTTPTRWWWIGSAVALGLVYCVGVVWVFMPKS